MGDDKDSLKAGLILGGLFAFEGFFVAMLAFPKPDRFLRQLGFLPGAHVPAGAGWICALVVTALFVSLSARSLPSVRANLLRPSGLKVLALGLAIAAGILEELSFRGLLMDGAAEQGAGAAIQVALSAFAFGAMHGVWGLFGRSWRAAVGATATTGLLGAGLAVTYLFGGRSLAPCVLAHFIINLLAEPGLVLAAARGEMGRARRPSPGAL